MNDLGQLITERKNKQIFKLDNKIIKLFIENHNASLVLNEALNQTRVDEYSNLNIPKLLEVKRYDNRWALISEYIDGKTISELFKMFPNNIKYYVDLFIDIQLLILDNKVPMLTRIKDKFKMKIENASNIDKNLKYDLLQRLEGLENGDSLCHGDYSPSNVIIRNDSIYILDWAHATIGNPAADAARTFLLFSMEGEEKLAEYYLDMFSKKSKIDKKYIQRWIPIVAASQYSKNLEEEKAFLSKWINVVDFE